MSLFFVARFGLSLRVYVQGTTHLNKEPLPYYSVIILRSNVNHHVSIPTNVPVMTNLTMYVNCKPLWIACVAHCASFNVIATKQFFFLYLATN